MAPGHQQRLMPCHHHRKDNRLNRPKPIHPQSWHVPIHRTVSENPIPPIIILDNDQARPNTTDTVPTQAITEPEVMEIVDLTIDKSKTPSDGTRTPAKTDALSPPPERQSIKQAKTCTPTIMTRPKSPDSVPRHPFQPLR